MGLGFSGEVSDLYHRHRHGYPAQVIAALVDGLGLGAEDLAVDLGCGTGQLTLALAPRVRAVIGIDPEPDMLARARREAARTGVRNAGWMLASDADVPLVGRLLGEGSVAAVTVAQALHWMDDRRLFAAARPLLRSGGGIAVISNGIPLWLHDSDWSLALRAFLERWLSTRLTDSCGTDEPARRRYARDLDDAGYAVTRAAYEYVAELDFAQLAGGVLSALSEARLPHGEQRAAFMRELRGALEPAETFEERVPVVVLIGRLRSDSGSIATR